MNFGLIFDLLSSAHKRNNFIQEATSTQGYNRYVYVYNNPLKYKDPSGEFVVVDSWLLGFVHGFFSTGSGRWSAGWNEANQRAGNDAKIWGGLFVSDPNKTFFGRVWEVVSRFTWQLPQTIGGFMTAHSYNTFGLGGGVESVDYKYGATVVKTRNYWGGVTQGSYIVGDASIEADPNNPLFQHEYGHYIQSQATGWAFYPRYGIPSILSTGDHDFHPAEQDANRRAFLYFNKNVDGFYVTESEANKGRGWNFYYNPLNVDGSNKYGQYVDYKSQSDIQALDKLKVSPKWYDYSGWLAFPVGPIGVGLYNAWR